MKKIIFVISFVIFSLSNIYAQFGIRVGVNSANESRTFVDKPSDFSTDHLTAFQIGVVYQHTSKHTGLGMETGALFSQKGSFFEYNDLENVQAFNELNYFMVPLNIRFTPMIDSPLNVYGSAGVYAGYLFSGKTTDENSNESETITYSSAGDRIDYGIAAGAGIILFKHIQLGATWSWGLKGRKIPTQLNAFLNDSKDRNFSVNLTYVF